MNKTVAIFTFLLVGFVIWRNYGVIAKGATVDLTNTETNEQKELFKKVSGKSFKQGDVVKTSFGYYTFENNKWKKTNEVWEK
jgi:hypothetical protein